MRIFTKEVELSDLLDLTTRSVTMIDLIPTTKELKDIIDAVDYAKLVPEKGVFTLGSVVDRAPPEICGMNIHKYVPYKKPMAVRIPLPETSEFDMLAYTLAAVLAEVLTSEFCVDNNAIPNVYRYLQLDRSVDIRTISEFMTSIVRVVGKIETDIIQTLKEWGLYDFRYSHGQMMIINKGNALSHYLGRILKEREAERQDALEKGLIDLSELTEEERSFFL